MATLAEGRARHQRQLAYVRQRAKSRRRQVIRHYGGMCDCCSEDRFEFLALDHINGGGEQHRLEVGSGAHMISWIIANNYPPIFRVLCHNCNQAIGYYGRCPHEESQCEAS